MKEPYDFSNARPNPYAEKMKKGYSVAIHYETPEDIEENSAINTIKSLIKQPGLNSLHLYIKAQNGNNENDVSNYTKWQEDLFEDMSIEEISKKATELRLQNVK